MKGIKYKYSVDALKVCYSIKEQTYNKLTADPENSKKFIFKSPNYQNVETEDFRLTRIKNKKREFNILIPDEEETGNLLLYATLRIKADNDEDFSGLCFIEFDNRRLYEPYYQYNNVKFNTIGFLPEITSRLGLELVSISSLELAFDSNINFARLIKSAIANEDYIPVINNAPYPDINSRDGLNNTHLHYSTTRKRAVNLSYLIKQAKGRLQLKCYDKSREITTTSTHKSYIHRWLDMEKNIHRMEITAKREPINAFCKQTNLTLVDFLYCLHTGQRLEEAYSKWLFQLLHFKWVGKSRKTFLVFDLPRLRKNAICA